MKGTFITNRDSTPARGQLHESLRLSSELQSVLRYRIMFHRLGLKGISVGTFVNETGPHPWQGLRWAGMDPVL